MRSFGKQYAQYIEFITAVKRGEKAIVFGNGYVVISENLYQKINETKNKIIIEYLEDFGKIDKKTYEKIINLNKEKSKW